jgi:hypothetical protein
VRTLGWISPLYWALRGAADRLGTPIPAEWLQSLGAQANPLPTLAEQRRNIRHWMVEAFTALDMRARWRMAQNFFLPGREYMLWCYHPQPTWLWRFYYLRRWGDMAGVLRHSGRLKKSA